MVDFNGLEHIVRRKESLSTFTGLRFGGICEYFAEPTSEAELTELVKSCNAQEVPIRVLGGGSNLIVCSNVVPGMVIHLSAAAFCHIEVVGSTIKSGGGAALVQLISTAAREGLEGLEQLAGIPGTVGGAVRTNAGTNSGDIGQRTTSVTVLTRGGDLETRGRDELRFSYRKSSLNDLVVLAAEFELQQADANEITRKMQTLWIVNKGQQPLGRERSLCMFQDHGGVKASSLIEQAGLKGFKQGGVTISDSHANYMIVDEGATCADALGILTHIQAEVDSQLGVSIKKQIEIW
ncbi:MAG: UDP-N-acetylmuramate dehydrogenase [Pirellulales bacterium]|jgi:UDP-N-acetylmuramate dehydrogenase